MTAPRLHPFWRLLLVAVGVLMAASIVQFFGLIAILLFTARAGVGVPIDKRIGELAVTYALPLTVLSYPLALGVLYLFRTQLDNRSWRSLGFARERALPNFARGALTALLTLSVLFGLMWLAGAIRFGGWASDALSHSALYAISALLVYGLGFGAVGFFEETLFRGYALANLRDWIGWRGAVAVQAVVFAAVHLTNGIGKPEVFRAALAGLPSLALIAVFFALSYRKTGSLWFPIGFHVAWNWLLGCVFSLPVSGIPTFRLFNVQETGLSFLSGGQFGAESSFFLIPLLLAMIYAVSLAPDHPRAVANLDAPEPSQSAQPIREFAPNTAPVFAAIENGGAEPVADEEPRANRYGARFGSAQGFDSEMLRELKQMQDARDEAQRARDEAARTAQRAEEARAEELRRAQIAAQSQVVAAEQTETLMAVEAPAEIETPVTLEKAPATLENNPVIVQIEAPAARVPTAPAPSEQTPVAAPPRPSLEPRRPSLEPRRSSLEPRRSTLEPKPASQPAPPVVTAPDDAPTAPPTDAPAPPKKARPRW